ncbi:MAG: maleylacetoacetate isomerase [Hyphomicrobiaceae bacterium]
MKLYGYFRSSAAYRVRIALNLKSIAVEHVPVHLVKDGGRQKLPAYLAKNPQALVPALALDDGTVITQSLAIIEYLDQLRPEPRLLPADPIAAAKVRAVALAIACDIHPLNNLRVLNYLKGPLAQPQPAVDQWIRHWILAGGLEPIEEMIAGGPYCFGANVTLADVCLVPQVFNARRFAISLEHLPKVLAVDAACQKLDAFAAAQPMRQADAE